MSRLIKVIAIKLARQPEYLAELSDLWYNLPRLTTWVGWVLLSPVKSCGMYSIESLYAVYHKFFSIDPSSTLCTDY